MFRTHATSFKCFWCWVSWINRYRGLANPFLGLSGIFLHSVLCGVDVKEVRCQHRTEPSGHSCVHVEVELQETKVKIRLKWASESWRQRIRQAGLELSHSFLGGKFIYCDLRQKVKRQPPPRCRGSRADACVMPRGPWRSHAHAHALHSPRSFFAELGTQCKVIVGHCRWEATRRRMFPGTVFKNIFVLPTEDQRLEQLTWRRKI